MYYRHFGKQVNFKLGSHGSITPAQARDMAKAKAGEVAKKLKTKERTETYFDSKEITLYCLT
nr:Arm DNA-binding domain-containing protein [Marinifaba aquimaris]